MADRIPPEVRSRIMSRIRGQNTRPEMYVRQTVWRHGFRYRLNARKLPGTPDLVFPRFKTALFVHGCFWHQHGCSRTSRPSSNHDYWDRKLDRNVERDAQNQARLKAIGWTVVTVWECNLEEGTAEAISLLENLRAEQMVRMAQAGEGKRLRC